MNSYYEEAIKYHKSDSKLSYLEQPNALFTVLS